MSTKLIIKSTLNVEGETRVYKVVAFRSKAGLLQYRCTQDGVLLIADEALAPVLNRYNSEVMDATPGFREWEKSLKEKKL